MSENERPERFVRRNQPDPAQDGGARIRATFLDCLVDIDSYLDEARRAGRVGFEPRTARYAAASLAIVRAAALFENEDFTDLLADVPMGTRRGITATRNIIAHAGYATMNDDVFWHTVDVSLPSLIAALRATAEA